MAMGGGKGMGDMGGGKPVGGDKPKSRADVIQVIKGAGSDPGAIYDALVAEGCIKAGAAEGPGEEGEEKSPFDIGEKDDMKTSRGKAAGFAADFFKKKEKPGEEMV